MPKLARLTAIGLAAAVPFSAAPAEAAPSKAVKKVYRDCSDGKINKKHKLKNLKKAKRTLPKDIKQYTGCSKALKKQIKKQKRR